MSSVRNLLISLLFVLSACQGVGVETEVTPEILPTASGETMTAATETPARLETRPLEPTQLITATVQGSATVAIPEPTALPPTPTEHPLTSSETPDAGIAAKSISLELLAVGELSSPVYLTHAFDERLFVVEQIGRIRIIDNGHLLASPFMARFEVSPNDPEKADASTEVILLTIRQPFRNHNGGQIQFGPDGYLYIGMGDGGSGGDPRGNGQDPETLLGALLRLDVDQEDSERAYRSPTDNPFAGDQRKRDEIWAFGLRNPWRFSFDRRTGDLYIADVGQNAREEVHFQLSGSIGGENYGWNIMEGTRCFGQATCVMTGLELPIFEFDRSQGCSITGGYVYRGGQFPTLYGNYFASDFCSGTIWRLFREVGGFWSVDRVLDSGLSISSFGEDVNGELYVLDYHNGHVFQVRP
jgi:glucose/arabinose dehydrogenase